MKIALKDFDKDRPLVLEEEIRPEDLDLDIGMMSFPEALILPAEAWK